MSSGKWQKINGLRYQVEVNEWENPNEDSDRENPNEESFTHDGKVWDVVREVSLDEAIAIAGNQKKDWSDATDEELMVHTFGYGASRFRIPHTETIVVKLGDEKTQMPFGFVENAPLLELLWRQTGADCPDEEADLEFPHGTYHILLQE